MEMAENPKLDLASSCGVFGLEENMGSQKISVSDHINGFQYTTEKSDSFVIDMESFSNGSHKDTNPNSRITRSFSRKGSSLRGNENKMNSKTTDKDSMVAISSPKGSSTPEKAAAAVPVGSMDPSSNPQVHHQITITTNTTTTEGRFALRRNSFKRSSSSWILDPKRVLFFFATLSSMGTILLIYFTLSISKYNGDQSASDGQE